MDSSDSIVIPCAGKAAQVPFTPTDPVRDRLRVAWCILAVPAMIAGKKSIAMPDRYLAKTIARIPDDLNEIRPKAGAWAAQVRAKAEGKVPVRAALRMLLGNQLQAGLLWVQFPDGAVDRDILRTAQLLLGHSTEHGDPACATCSAIRSCNWTLAMRLAAGVDAPIALGALIELYRGAAAAGLVPFVVSSPDGLDPVEQQDSADVERPDQGQPYRPEDLF
jgi:hypothetical protein